MTYYPFKSTFIYSCIDFSTKLGMVVACLIKEIQVTSELRRMAEIDLVAKSVIDNLIVQKFEAPLPKCQDDDDPFIKGEFDVVKELLEKV